MEKHLQLLLKEVNTVIVPGLGALTVTNHSTGEIMFMPYLKYDDGKLSAYIASQDNCSDEEAKGMIASHVTAILNSMNSGGTFAIKGLGSFSKDSSGDIQFSDGVVEESTTVEKVEVPEKVEVVSETPVSNEITVESEKTVENVDNTISPIIETVDPGLVTEELPVAIPPVVTSPKKGFFGMFKKKSPAVEEKGASEEIESEVKEEIHSETFVLSENEPEVKEEITQQIEEIKEDELIINEEPALEVEVITEPVAEVVTTLVIEKEPVQESSPVAEEEIESITSVKNDPEEEVSVTDEPIKTKKKKGVVFWMLMSFLVIFIGGGVYVGLNYDEMKQYLPFTSSNSTKTIDIPEEDIIKTLESDKTTPSKTETSASEEMIETETPVETPTETTVESSVPEETVSIPTEVAPKPKKKVKPSSSTGSSSGAAANSSGEYHIVLASFTEKTNAESYVAKMISQGKSSATFIERDGKFVACYGSYSTKDDALSNLSGAREISTNAWVLHKP